MAWVGRDAYMEPLWALDGIRAIKLIMGCAAPASLSS